jgi:non-heme chloroperoxidase
MKVHEVTGGGALRLHVREWGRADGAPILFIHGWSQSHLCWKKQYESALADEFRLVAFDLRGHGMSDAPLDAQNYVNAQPWADDIAAVIDQLELARPVLVGWSYGGFVICDFVRAYGQRKIAGINFVGAAVKLGPTAFGSLIGPGFLNHFPGATADDLPTNIEAIRAFVRACTARPLAAADYEQAICWNMVVPPKVRAALAMREIDCDDVLSSLDVPVLVSHGEMDTVILPAMSHHIAQKCRAPTKLSWYAGAGHAAHMEEPGRFNAELEDFARHTSG